MTTMVERMEIALPRLPEIFDGLTIAVIADLHAGLPWRRETVLRRLVEMVNALHPHVIAVLGDVVHWYQAGPHYVPILGGLRAPHGVYACLGNHEHGRRWYSQYLEPLNAPTREEWRALYDEAGLRLLVNEAVAVEQDGTRLWIGGVDDPYSRCDDLGTTVRGLPQEDCKIILAHSPDVIDDAQAHEVDLVLAGHTHGGQVRLPRLGTVHCSCHRPRERAAGLIRVDGTYLYVSRGAGEGLPIRVNCPREIPLVTLRRATVENGPGPRES
jgi:uncharacterized protein